MGAWTKRYLRIKNPDSGLDWRLRYGDRFEIVGELDDYYFLWAGGTMVGFPMTSKYEYTIETEIINTE